MGSVAVGLTGEFADPRALLREVFGEHVAPPGRMSVDVWADRYRRVSARASPEPGPWRTDRAPYLRGVMRAWTDPETRAVVLMSGAQIGKTEVLINCMFHDIDRDPGPMLFVWPNDQLAKQINKTRLVPTMRETPAIARHMTASKHDVNALEITLDNCDLFFTGANSAAALAAKPIRRLYFDELNKAPQTIRGRGNTEGSALELARERLSSFGDMAKELLASTPTEENVGIDNEWKTTDQARFYVPCPRCGAWQTFRFGADGDGGVRWEGGLGTDLDDVQLIAFIEEVRLSAWYECKHCAGRIESHEKAAMLREGVWIAKGQDINPATGEITGERVRTSRRGFHLPQTASSFVTFGDVAVKFVRARGRMTRAFVNSVLGEPWKKPGRGVEHQKIIDMATDPTRADGYAMGTVPRGVLVLTATVDVQQDHAYVEIDGWGEDERRWLIDARRVPCPELEDGEATDGPLHNWQAVRDALDRVFPRDYLDEEGEPLPPLSVRFEAIDSGFRTGEVYAFVRERGERCYAIKGQTNQTAALRWSVIDTWPGTTKPIPGGVQLLSLSDDYWQDEIHRRMLLRHPAPHGWSYPRDLPISYARQLTSEERYEDVSKRGVIVQTWRLKPGRSDNHYRDTGRYGLALATAFGLRDLRAVPPTPRRAKSLGDLPRRGRLL